ncbi:MAG: ParB/RepB/Spo0J family partition protein [Spirochaetota bacterium]|nr:ParB/RepB/Spo0J family partition protein [Spirochaetota bacterium]
MTTNINTYENILSSLNKQTEIQIIKIPISKIKSNPIHFRKDLPESDLIELANSIKEIGLLHPILVRKSEDGFIIISGERRFRAYKILNSTYTNSFNEISSQIVDSNIDFNILSLSENIQRQSLTTFEESHAIYELIGITKKGYKDLGILLGKSEDYIEKRVRYFRLNESIKSRIKVFSPAETFLNKLDKLCLSKVLILKPLITHWTEKESYDLLCKIIDEELTVREINNELIIHQENKQNKRIIQRSRDTYDAINIIDELDLLSEVGTNVKHPSNGSLDNNNSIKILSNKKHKPIKKLSPSIESILSDIKFWDVLINFLQERLNIVINNTLCFKKAFHQLIRRYAEA